MKSRMLAGLGLLVLAAGPARGAELPLESVSLFTSGVGYFERAARIQGAGQVELLFRTDQIPDLIKSLVVLDESGGSVMVTAESRDPVERTLQSFSVNLSDNPPLAQLLNRARGTPVRVRAGSLDATGEVLGAESRTVVHGPAEKTVEEWTLNLFSDGQVQSVRLEAVQSVEFLDAAVRDDLAAALRTLGGNLSRDRKTVRIGFSGDRPRTVRVGYVLEAPVWKTSYRLVLDGEAPFLQGWAHVENMTEEDWNGVTLSLISGRPFSFIQNLYDPIYLRRPVVEPALAALAAPPEFDGILDEREMRESGVLARRREDMDQGFGAGAPGSEVRRLYAGRMAAAPASPQAVANALRAGVVEQAAAQEVGELFAYHIEEPVTLPRHRSAMIPILAGPVAGESLSIFNESVNPRFPHNGVEIENTSGRYLMQGPVAVYEDGVYAGDARLSDTPRDEKKLLSFALDTASEVSVNRQGGPEEILSVRVINGVLHAQRKHVETVTYVIRNRRDRERAYLVEHPRRDGWDLVEPRNVETTHDRYRFRTAVAAGGSATLAARQERISRETIAVSGLRDNQIRFFLEQRVLSPAVRNALQEIARRQAELAGLRARREEAERAQAGLITEQSRLRENMGAVDRNSASFAMWERKLVEQEGELASLRDQQAQLRAEERDKTQQLAQYLSTLTVE